MEVDYCELAEIDFNNIMQNISGELSADVKAQILKDLYISHYKVSVFKYNADKFLSRLEAIENAIIESAPKEY